VSNEAEQSGAAVRGLGQDILQKASSVVFARHRGGVPVRPPVLLPCHQPLAMQVVHDGHDGRVGDLALLLKVINDLAHRDRAGPLPQAVHHHRFQLTELPHRSPPPTVSTMLVRSRVPFPQNLTPPMPRELRTLPLALAGGLLAALAFEPVGNGWLAPLAMSALWLAVTRSSWQAALLHGAGFGAAFTAVLLWWLVDSMGWLAWALLGGTQAMAIAVAAAGVKAVSRLPAGPVWAGAVWALVETTRSAWPLGGMPWGRLGVTALDTPWETLLPYAGIAGTGFFVATAGFALGGIALQQRAWSLAVLASAFAALSMAVAVPYAPSAQGTFRLAVVQGGVPGDGRDLAGHHRQVTANHVRETLELAERISKGTERPPDLVVWPENSTAVDPLRHEATRIVIDEAVSALGVPTLVGGIFDGPDDATAYNRGILWLPDGRTGATYTKTHPVPFGEYIPWRSVIGGWSSRFQLIPRDFLAGSGDGPLDLGGIQVADAICFDVAYDDVLPDQVRRGAQLVTVQTSNATFFGTSQPEQQFEITRARALELSRSVAVASTNGISAVVDPNGRVTARSSDGSATVLVADVPLSDAITPAVRLQTLQKRLLAGLAVAGLLWCTGSNLRQRSRISQSTFGAAPPMAAHRDPLHDQEASEDHQRQLAETPAE
jgi:apolipoprotein N-acyltransferase